MTFKIVELFPNTFLLAFASCFSFGRHFIYVMLWCRISCNKRAGKEAVLYRIWFHVYLFFIVAPWNFNLSRPSANKYHLSELQNCGSEKWLGSLASRMLVMDLGNFFSFVSASFTFWYTKCPVYFVIVKSLPLQYSVNTFLTVSRSVWMSHTRRYCFSPHQVAV